jgi:hypothetical protein
MPRGAMKMQIRKTSIDTFKILEDISIEIKNK